MEFSTFNWNFAPTFYNWNANYQPFPFQFGFSNSFNFDFFTLPTFTNSETQNNDLSQRINNNSQKIVNLSSELEDATNKIGEYQKKYLQTNDSKWENLMNEEITRRDKIEIELHEAEKTHEELIKKRKTELNVYS